MKSVTEFPSFKLVQGLKAKQALAAEGKTPEEIQASLGTTFKYEGDKLKHFTNAIEVASQNLEKLSRVLVLSFAEGESAPVKAQKIEEHHYLPEFQVEAKAVAAQTADVKGGKGGKKGGKGGKGDKPRSSPWGISPEEKAAKAAAAARAQREKSQAKT